MISTERDTIRRPSGGLFRPLAPMGTILMGVALRESGFRVQIHSFCEPKMFRRPFGCFSRSA
jgi:hypothetical protein